MNEHERLTKLEVLIDDTINQLHSLKETDTETLNQLAEIKYLLTIITDRNQELSEVNDMQNKQIEELIKSIESFNNKIKFALFIENVLKSPIFYVIVVLLLFIATQDVKILEFLEKLIL